jgi:protoheme IX farnesyltransferase
MRLNLLVVFSAAIGYLVAQKGDWDWSHFMLLCLGGFLVTGGATALNQVLEKDLDRLMPRTENRPLAAGRMGVTEAVLAAGVMTVAGTVVLASFNTLTALLGVLSMLSYCFVYTPMKRISPLAVLVGAFPGALPSLIGWVAVTGRIDSGAWILFSIQFIWQFPHFWAIAWVAHEDYLKAGFNLLPSGKKDRQTTLQILIYTVFLIPMGILPYIMGISGVFSAIICTTTAFWFFYTAVKLYTTETREAALGVMFGSFIYLPSVLLAIFFDKI